MLRVKWISNEGKRILYVDLSYVKDLDEVLNVIRQTERNLQGKPRNSVSVIVNAYKLKFSSDSGQIIINFLQDNEMYIKALAIIGLSGIKRRMLARYISSYNRSDIAIFKDIEEAKDWVVQ